MMSQKSGITSIEYAGGDGDESGDEDGDGDERR